MQKTMTRTNLWINGWPISVKFYGPKSLSSTGKIRKRRRRRPVSWIWWIHEFFQPLMVAGKWPFMTSVSQSLFYVIISYDMAQSYEPYDIVNILETIWPLERFEISVCGVPFTIHLKDVDYTKNGKRWSQVMYMNYLVKYKINVLKAEKISAYRKGDKKGLTIFDRSLPFTYPLLTLNLPSIRNQLLTYSF